MRETPQARTAVPSWGETEKWWIQAKSDPSATAAEVRLMLRTLLAERFQLRLHVEKREQSYYALEVRDVARAQARLTEAPPGRPVRTTLLGDRSITNQFTFYSMFALARDLAAEMERVVIDDTKLLGTYTFAFEGLRDRGESNPLAQQRLAPLVGEVGLRLESRKGPVDVYVIDSVERPSEN